MPWRRQAREVLIQRAASLRKVNVGTVPREPLLRTLALEAYRWACAIWSREELPPVRLTDPPGPDTQPDSEPPTERP